MKEDEVRALEELEVAWGLRGDGSKLLPSVTCPACGVASHHPKDVEFGYCARCHKFHDDMVWTDPKTGASPDDGATPPNFLLVEKTEFEEYGVLEAPTWAEWAREVREQLPPLFTVDTPWLTAAVCVVTVLATAAVVLSVVGRNGP